MPVCKVDWYNHDDPLHATEEPWTVTDHKGRSIFLDFIDEDEPDNDYPNGLLIVFKGSQYGASADGKQCAVFNLEEAIEIRKLLDAMIDNIKPQDSNTTQEITV